MPRTKGSRALPDGRGRAGVELGGTSGYRVGRGLGCRLGVVERHTVEPALPLRGPLNGTAVRHVPRPEDAFLSVAPVGAAVPQSGNLQGTIGPFTLSGAWGFCGFHVARGVRVRAGVRLSTAAVR